MLELKPKDRLLAQACLADPSMNISSSGAGVDTLSTESTEALPEQPTEMLTLIQEPLPPPVDDPEAWDQSTTPQGSRKRLRSSSSSAGSPVIDDLPTRASAGRHLGMTRAPRDPTTNLHKVHITEGRIGCKTIAKPSEPSVKHIPPVPGDVGKVSSS